MVATRTMPETAAQVRMANGAARRRLTLETVLFYLVAIALGLIFLFPFFWAVTSSLKTISEINTFPPLLFPAVPQWQNYTSVLVDRPFGLWVRNSVFVVLASTSGALLSSSLIAYSFARFNYRGRDLLFLITLGTLMLPAQVTLIPQYILFSKLGWINTLQPLWVPYWFGGGPFSIFLLRQFILSLPRDLDEAALTDGASPFRIYWSIVMPLCKPALATLAILWFVNGWNDFLAPIVYLSTPDNFTVAIGLNSLKQLSQFGGQRLQNDLMAASVMATLPCIAIFLAGQRYFVRGVVLSGLKG